MKRLFNGREGAAASSWMLASARAAIIAIVLFLASGSAVFGLEGELAVDGTPSASQQQFQGFPGRAGGGYADHVPARAERAGPGSDVFSLSATAWGLLDSLPDFNPNVRAGTVSLFQAACFRRTWSGRSFRVPDLGHGQGDHPSSSGFFWTPLNLISRGPARKRAAANTRFRSPVGGGWIGTKLLWIVGELSVENFFSPQLQMVEQCRHGPWLRERATARLSGSASRGGARGGRRPSSSCAVFHRRPR